MVFEKPPWKPMDVATTNFKLATEMGSRMLNALRSRVEYALQSLVPDGHPSPIDYLRAHGCQVADSRDSLKSMIFMDGREVGSWELVFEPYSVRVELTGILDKPTVCPVCCRSLILERKAIPGDRCQGCQDFFLPEDVRTIHHVSN